MNSRAFNVYLASNDPALHNYDDESLYPYTVDSLPERVCIDTVYYNNTDTIDADYVRTSLIEHDGYPTSIIVEEDVPQWMPKQIKL